MTTPELWLMVRGMDMARVFHLFQMCGNYYRFVVLLWMSTPWSKTMSAQVWSPPVRSRVCWLPAEARKVQGGQQRME
jgi:hypothetical protein